VVKTSAKGLRAIAAAKKSFELALDSDLEFRGKAQVGWPILSARPSLSREAFLDVFGRFDELTRR
jgi:hypothetical protein